LALHKNQLGKLMTLHCSIRFHLRYRFISFV